MPEVKELSKDTKDLVRKRASYKGKVTMFSNYLNTLDPSSLSPTEVSELQLRFTRLEALYTQYDEVQLFLECTTDDLDGQMSERAEFESLYYKTLSKAQQMLVDNKKRDSSDNCDLMSRSSNHKFVKLPTIQLPKFSGSYTNWLEFHDTFVSLIHSNDDMDEINKFHYLRSSLEGSAAVVINSIQFSSANYSVAWNLLCERFDNKHLLIQHHVSALFQIDTLQKESSVNLKGLLDVVNKNIRALESLDEPVNHWDTLLIYIVTHKLDSKTYREWGEYKGRLDKNSKVTFGLFITFIKDRAEILETFELEATTNTKHSHTGKNSNKVRSMLVQDSNKNNSGESSSKQDEGVSNKPKNCVMCNGDHKLCSCPQFLSLSNEARLQLLPKYKVCYNCFNLGHYANNCKRPSCKICRRKHNTIVHVDKSLKSDASGTSASCVGVDTNDSAAVSTQPTTIGTGVSLSASVEHGDVLLSTALVKVMSINGQQYVARAVLDSGSTSCLMTERLYHQLGLTAKTVNNSIIGINNSSSFINKMCSVPIKSLNNDFSMEINCFILPSITDRIPSKHVNLLKIKIPSDVCLADPNFYSPAPVDMLLGADIFWDLLESQRIKLGDGQPILCETKLGWLVSGPINSCIASKVLKCNLVKVRSDCDDELNCNVDQQLTKFWQLEEVGTSSPYSSEEKLCEEHFVKNTTRLGNGQFCVRIPLKCSPDNLGESLSRAKHCFASLERRFKSKITFSNMYKEFMMEYETLGHMSRCKTIDNQAFYVPHHGVLRESSSTTKLRVVFNASSVTNTGISINHIQMIGPVVQDDLLSILLRFRQHKYILAADVEKMYRQIVVHPNDRYLQQIIWRDNPSTPLHAYQLNTVTYGTASAPYLATRCLRQLGLECVDKEIGEVILHDFYVDDLLTGGDDMNKVKELRHKVTSTLASAQMNLRKWKSNDMQLVTGDFPQSSLDLNVGGFESTKTLGLGWQPLSDYLWFPISQSVNFNNTKRDMLSIVSQVFDPLGLLAPCVIVMKILLQKLWLKKLSWDEQLSPDISKLWNEIIINLPKLNEIHIPRRVLIDYYEFLEFHIYTDASERAYGACLYVRSVDKQGQVLVRLLLAKSRVAPLKPTTIPRLELCGALVGVRIYEKVVAALRVSARRTFFWTDSTIVLGWLKMLPNKLQPFVRNRVAEILDKTSGCEWRHVPTDQNPADHLSRGLDINLLPSLDIWWSGPSFLMNEMSDWPSKLMNFNNEILPEIKLDVTLHVLLNSNEIDTLIDFTRFSNFLRLQRTVAYVLRFIEACKKQPIRGPLSVHELERALNFIIFLSQRQSFKDYKLLLNKKSLPKKSELNKFNVFLDENNIMRIRGRLQHSDFPYNKKHPILINSSHHFSKLLFSYEHKRLFHAGPQLLLASIRETYWPIRGRNLARMSCKQCVRCCRFRGETVSPIMGDLPQQRLLAGFPFENIGLDYAGPIQSAVRQGRGCKLVKVYIAIFVCFSTKSIHLELVGDLTSNTFIMALKRFISRRGKPKNIYSDNGTSFVGASNDLSRFLKVSCDSLSEEMAKEGITFHFIPAYSPHFAGLAEAGVKSTKHHLVRVLGLCNLTYEELYTMMVQVEAILNSRPLTPLSSNPEDLTPLTPGHFLIGRPITSLPSPDYRDQSINSLSRFERIELLRQHFWSRWSKEYISELQLRMKWRACKGSLRLNSLVLLKEDNLPPLKWKMGRIVATYPGTDGIVRVADIKTSNGLLRRSFSKICPLPIYPEAEDI